MTDRFSARNFDDIARWCQEYLERQHSADVGRQMAALLRVLGQIATAPRDDIDRFDWLKGREVEVLNKLSALADAHAAACEERQRLAGGRPGNTAESVAATRLFVYGTLKRGHRRSPALDGQRFLGIARTAARYRLLDCGGYPALVESADGRDIEGELWEVDAEGLARLDQIEGVDLRLYQRRTVILAAPFDELACEAYFYCRAVTGLRDCGGSWPAPEPTPNP
jgi:gamma-glutamylaminecyclotransferase